MDDTDDFIPNEDDEWADEDGLVGILPAPDNNPVIPQLDRTRSGAKTIFVTYQMRVFEDDYRKVNPIGQPGQFGIAYECYRHSDTLKTPKCVKEINKARFHHIAAEARNEMLATMQNEIAILKRVDHPNIVKLYDVYEDRHRLHLVMEYLPGGELFARICEKESFSEREAVHILKQIMEALDHMHDKNILHLDLKPDNILFTHKGEDSPIKLIDFGMARVVPRLAKLKDRVGTPNYMAPEVLSGHYSKAADIWSVGVIAFCMLFGFPPFYTDSDAVCLDEYSALESKIKAGFDPTVKEGFGPWFPAENPVSEHCRYLLSKMLDTDVRTRWTVKECLSSTWIDNFEHSNTKTIPPIVRHALKKFHSTSKFKVAISNLFTNQLDGEHVTQIKKFFNRLDTDHNGSVSLLEFKTGMHNMDTELSDEQLEQIFSNVDVDDDREITLDELMTITAHRMLIDEDERLYQAFQDLDENGDGMISQLELENALQKHSVAAKTSISKPPTHQRFSSAFLNADRNGDGQIDYEEFLRILHPDFDDDMVTLDEFKNNVSESSRVRGAQFNVDYKPATASEFMEVLASPKKEGLAPGTQQMQMQMKMKTLTLDAFKKRQSETDLAESKDVIKEQKQEIVALKERNAKLEEKLVLVEASRDELRQKYETELFSKFSEQNKEIRGIKENLRKSSEAEQGILVQKIGEIAELKGKLEEREKEIEGLKGYMEEREKAFVGMDRMLQRAIESKMQSLIASQEEIQKLRDKIVMSNKRGVVVAEGKRKKKARHLSHLVGK